MTVKKYQIEIPSDIAFSLLSLKFGDLVFVWIPSGACPE
jgi:hypothetical protein